MKALRKHIYEVVLSRACLTPNKSLNLHFSPLLYRLEPFSMGELLCYFFFLNYQGHNHVSFISTVERESMLPIGPSKVQHWGRTQATYENNFLSASLCCPGYGNFTTGENLIFFCIAPNMLVHGCSFQS